MEPEDPMIVFNPETRRAQDTMKRNMAQCQTALHQGVDQFYHAFYQSAMLAHVTWEDTTRAAMETCQNAQAVQNYLIKEEAIHKNYGSMEGHTSLSLLPLIDDEF